MDVNVTAKVRPITFVGCGHVNWIEEDAERGFIKTGNSMHCINCGYTNVFSADTDEQTKAKQKRRLTKLQGDLEAEKGRGVMLQNKLEKTASAAARLRDRIKKGLCPCCNRSFQNLWEHMSNKHPEFDDGKTLASVRSWLDLTQSALAEELHLSPGYISAYERGRYLPEHASRSIDRWLEKAD